MTVCDGDEASVYRADNAVAGATAGQITSTCSRLVFLSLRTSRSTMALSRGLRRSLRGTLVVVSTVATAVEVMVAMAMRWRMTTKWGCMRPTRLAPAQSLNNSPALGQRCGANEIASLAGLAENLGGRRGNVSSGHTPVSPDALGLAGVVVNGDRDGNSNPRR